MRISHKPQTFLVPQDPSYTKIFSQKLYTNNSSPHIRYPVPAFFVDFGFGFAACEEAVEVSSTTCDFPKLRGTLFWGLGFRV